MDPVIATARRLVRSADRAVLSTNQVDPSGWPFGSLIMLASDQRGVPIMLLSDLAVHSINLAEDPRAALLIDGTVGLDDPLTGPRLTILGYAEPTEDRAIRARYLARHPGAALYAGFKDFKFYLLIPLRAHLVAGFGRINWLEGNSLVRALPAKLAASERSLLETLNRDGGRLAGRLAQQQGHGAAEGWRITGLDPDGLDLRKGGMVGRVGFAQPVEEPEGIVTAIEAVLHTKGG